MVLKFSYVVAVLLFYIYNIGCVSCLFEDEAKECTDETASCVTINNCPVAISALMSTRSHNLQRCGFEGKIEKVCCPSGTNVGTKTTSNGRRSEQACIEYSNEVGAEPTINILGGEDAKLGEFPHMASLGYEKEEGLKWECGGSLISSKFVLTAAHCIINRVRPTKVRLGILNLEGDADSKPLDYGVFNISVHQQYNRRTKRNDIALIELDNVVPTTSNVHPACLYQSDDNPKNLIISGWGYTTANGEPSKILQKAMLHPVALAECTEVYESRMQDAIIASQICAISDDGTKDTCQGDSGGPLQVQKQPRSSIYSVVGVTSYGMGCGGKTPGVYTRVYSYLEWIEGIVWQSN